jgi:putative tryptophan/tyrosine transport system substrate-binding protein
MQFGQLKRREFVTLLCGAAAWPLATRGQQPDQVRRIGVLMGLAETDQFTQGYVRELRDGLHQLGWTDSRKIQIHISLRRWRPSCCAGICQRTRRDAA